MILKTGCKVNCKIQIEIFDKSKNETELEEHEYKYGLNQKVYYVYENLFGKYKIKECYIDCFCFTDIPSYMLNNGNIVLEESIFDDIDEAIKYCEKLNKRKRYFK